MKDTQQAENQENDDLSDSSLDLIGHLKPVSVVAADEESLSTVQPQEEEEESGHEVTVSREGKRKRRVSQAASMIKHHVRRRKKTEDQVAYLRTLFNQLGGKWDGKVRKEAMQKTGLSRI